MSFLAKAQIGGKEYNVLQCSYSLHRDVDHHGRPSSKVIGGTIQLTVESSDDPSLYNWMIDPYKTVDGKITFNKRDEESKLKELAFSVAYLTEYNESFDAYGSNPMKETFTLSAREIAVEGTKHENKWPI